MITLRTLWEVPREMATPSTKPRVREAADGVPELQDVHQVTDVLDKETESLETRFNKTFGDHAVDDIRFRYLSILAICRAGILLRSIRSMTDEKQIDEITHEFCNIRDILNRFFDFMESQKGD